MAFLSYLDAAENYSFFPWMSVRLLLKVLTTSANLRNWVLQPHTYAPGTQTKKLIKHRSQK